MDVAVTVLMYTVAHCQKSVGDTIEQTQIDTTYLQKSRPSIYINGKFKFGIFRDINVYTYMGR